MNMMKCWTPENPLKLTANGHARVFTGQDRRFFTENTPENLLASERTLKLRHLLAPKGNYSNHGMFLCKFSPIRDFNLT